MRNIKILTVITLLLIFGSTPVYAAPPMPARIGGTVTVNGTLMTQFTDIGYRFTVTKQNGAEYNPLAEDRDGLSAINYYIIDVPSYDSSQQPGGAPSGETAVIHVYINDKELTVTSPANGEYQVGSAGSVQQLNITVLMSNNPPPMPTLLFPANGQTGIGTSLVFKWEKTIDPDLNSVSYYLYCSENSDFTGSTIIHIASLENKQTYYAWNSAGLLFFGMVFSGGIRSRRKIVRMMLMIFVVVAIAVSCGAGGGGGGGSSGSSSPAPAVSNDVTQAVSGLSAGTPYYWKVVADDGNGGVTESATQSFTTQ